MSEPTAAASSPEPAPASSSWWEDFLEIFFAPSRVFARRRDASFWVPLLVFTVVGALLVLGLGSTLRPALEADIGRAIANNPKITPEMAGRVIEGQAKWGPYLFVAALPITSLLVGLVLWLVGKLFGAREGVGQAMLIAAFAGFPKLIGFLASGVQGLLFRPESLDGMSRLSLGPARFLDPDVASAGMIALMARFDLTLIWATILLALGLKAIAKVSAGSAYGTAVVVWVVGTIPSLFAFARG